jgi:hypothetical protein
VASAVVYAVPQDTSKHTVLLIDDFDNTGSRKNLLGGVIGGDDRQPGICSVRSDSSPLQALGRSGCSLALQYDTTEQSSFSYCYIRLAEDAKAKYPDLTSYSYLSFWAKGCSRKTACRIELHQDADADGRFDCKNDISSGVSLDRYLRNSGSLQGWRKVTIPLKDFKGITDFKRVCEVVMTFDGRAEPRQGTLYLDDLLFGSRKGASRAGAHAETRGTCSVNGRPLRDGLLFQAENLLKASVDGSDTEAVWFELSFDKGRTWRRIAAAYRGSGRIFSSEWNSRVYSGKRGLCVRARAVSSAGRFTLISPAAAGCAVKRGSSSDFLDMLEKKAFKYFDENQNEKTGLFRDTAGSGDASIAVTGFGIAALCIGAERGWIEKTEAQRRVLLAIRTFAGDREVAAGRAVAGKTDIPTAENKNGFFYHFLDYDTAERAGKAEISTIDTALLLCGMITAAEYFGGEIKTTVARIYERMDWGAFKDPRALGTHTLLLMGWTPEKGFIRGRWDYYSDETMLVALLAAGSRRNDISPEVFYDWKRTKGQYGAGAEFVCSWYGSLFTYQYAQIWFDLRGLTDREGINWFENSRRATIANRRFCIDQAAGCASYGSDRWGISSALGPAGYSMSYGSLPNGEKLAHHDGTITPLGAGTSISFAPFHAVSAMQNMYARYPRMRGRYGLKNSCNLDKSFYAQVDYGLDLGAFLAAMENFRSGFVWKYLMQNVAVRRSVQRVQLKPDPVPSPAGADIDGIARDMEMFLADREPGVKAMRRVIRRMEELVEANDRRSFALFMNRGNQVYAKIIRLTENVPAGTPDPALMFCRFAALLRLYRYGEADIQFSRYTEALKSRSADRKAYSDSLKMSLKEILSLKMVEGYVDRQYREYTAAVRAADVSGTCPGLRDVAAAAFDNKYYEEANRYYSDFLDAAEQRGDKEELIAGCGLIAERFWGLGKYDLAAFFDVRKAKCLIASAQKNDETERCVAETIRRYYDASRYAAVRNMGDLYLRAYPAGEQKQMVLFMRGHSLKRMNEIDAAIRDFSEIMGAHPERDIRGETKLLLGECYMAKSDDDRARGCFNEVIRSCAGSETAELALFNKGLLCYYAKDFTAARKIFEEIVGGNGSRRTAARKYLAKLR